MPEESPHAHFDRLKKQLQDTILRDYPNPERRGCPGTAALRALARRPLDDSIEGEPNWQHVTHCSECYREFLDFRAGMKRRQKVQRAGLAFGVAAIIVVAVVVVLVNRRGTRPHPDRPQIAELIYRPRAVDLDGLSMTRSEKGNAEKRPVLLGREPEELTIRLPFGSKAGSYEVQLLKTADRPLLSANGEAKIENGLTMLRVRMDLSPYEPGRYFFGVRQIPWDWTYCPAEIQ
jgi:predicted nucleic acid-binding Zn ribbon protein